MSKKMNSGSIEKFLELPKIEPIKPVIKVTNVLKPDVSMLTEEQLEIFNTITSLRTNVFSQTLLTGYSGTGKSFLVSKIIEELISKNSSISIGITAPTNKAVRVLKNLSMISETHSQVTFNTLHSLLGLKRDITHEGKEVYKSEFNSGSIGEFDIILVDEVSMLDNELYKILITNARIHKIMLLFIGDRGQIPPVNGGESVLFNSQLDNSFNLTKIIRQANGNPIIALAEKIRNNQSFVSENNIDTNNNGVVFLKINTEMEVLNKFFNSENFKKEPNFVKVLAWTNSAVDYYNDNIRKLIYGDKCGKLCVGEKMVCNKPILGPKNKILLNNNDEFEVVKFTKKTETSGSKFKHYSVDIISNGKPYTIKLLAEESEKDYNKELERLKKVAIQAPMMLRRTAWVKYFKYLEKYADVKYNYALTVHKSQGSTFDNVVVVNCDINRIREKEERNKLLYTAITRAKNKLIMI